MGSRDAPRGFLSEGGGMNNFFVLMGWKVKKTRLP